MKLHQLRLYLFPLDDLRCGYGIQQGNILPSLRYVPGRVVRGALAGWAVRRGLLPGSRLFQELFLPQAVNGYPISFPNCTYRGYRPVPLSLFSEKGTPLSPLESLIDDSKRHIHKGALPSMGRPVDFLRRALFPAQVDSSLKQVAGMVDDLDSIVHSAPLKIDIKNRHEETGSVGEDGLFAEELIPAANALYPERNYYSGTLVFEVDELAFDVLSPLVHHDFLDVLKKPKRKLLEKTDPLRIIFMGHHRVPVVGFADDLGVTDTIADEIPDELKDANHGKSFSWTALSDFIPAKGSGYPLTAKVLEDHLDMQGVTKIRVFCGKNVVHGFDVEAGQPLLPAQTIIAGSCGLFSCDLNETTRRLLWKSSLIGIGDRTRDGFGRFAVNWKIHSV